MGQMNTPHLNPVRQTGTRFLPTPKLENDRFMIYDRCPMTDVAMAISTDADTDADVAYLDHLVTS